MTTVYLVVKGGLGNQLFQAAFGLYLELMTGVQVRYLTHGFAGDNYRRTFLLDQFASLNGKVAPVEEAVGAPHYREPAAPQPPEQTREEVLTLIARAPERLILEGYWQNEIYFADARPVIQAALRLPLEDKAIELSHSLRQEGVVGMHVRRSDYGHHGLARTEYYRQAIDSLRAEVGPLPVLVFSDEYNFCSFEFGKIANLSVVRGDSQTPMIDFHLLSSCRHFILSNSSFSWWSAWLGASEDSLVFAPDPWCIFDAACRPAPPRWRIIGDSVQKQ
jgi:hypothetical protein